MKFLLILLLAASSQSRESLKLFSSSTTQVDLPHVVSTESTTTPAAIEIVTRATIEQCTSRSAGWTTANIQSLEAVIAEGQKSGSLDVNTREIGCSHIGIMATACDKDSAPLVIISNDLGVIDVYRNGNSTSEIKVNVKLHCRQLSKAWTPHEDHNIADVSDDRAERPVIALFT